MFFKSIDAALKPIGFTAENFIKVVSGLKWETRRLPGVLYKPNHFYWLQEPTKIVHIEGNLVECFYATDRTKALIHLTDKELNKFLNRKTDRVQPGRFQYKSTARYCVYVATVKTELLQNITPSRIKAEGVSSGDVKEFQSLWDSIYSKILGASWESNPTIQVIEINEVVAK